MKNDSSRDCRFRPLAAICAIIAVAAGVTSLGGWLSGRMLLAGLAPGMLPMAPSTALLFIIYGSALLLHLFRPESHVAQRMETLVISAGALLALLLFIISSLGIHPDFEHPGMAVTGMVGKAPIGHISPVGALCFVIAGLSFLASQYLSPNHRWRATTAWWLASLLIAVNAIFLLAYLYGMPLLYGGTIIPPAALTVVAFLALGTALLAISAPMTGLLYRINGTEKSAIYLLICVFVILACGILVAGYLYFRNFEERYRLEAESRLSAIADLKVAELTLWRKERLGDGDVIHGNPAFSALVGRYIANPADKQTGKELKGWIIKLQEVYKYDKILLLDARNVERISTSTVSGTVSPFLAQNASESLHSGKVIFVDFHQHGNNDPVHLSILVPIIDETRVRRALGVLVLVIDPEWFLYPYIEHWPVPSNSGETLMVRKDGNEVVFLNKLRFKKIAPLSLRLPLTRTDLPATRAVLGKAEVLEGVDYRGVQVIASLRPVPGSPWFLVAKMDKVEIYAPIRERLWLVILLIATLLIGSGAVVGLIWREQSTAFYKEKLRGEQEKQESAERLRLLGDNLPNSYVYQYIHETDGTPRFLYLSAGVERLHGVSREEVLHDAGKLYRQIDPEQMPAQVAMETVSMQSMSDFEMELPICRADGERRWLRVRSRPRRKADGQVIWDGVATDITEHKLAEQKIEEKNAELERFIYMISHDLKSPLVTIKTFLGYLEQDLADSDATRIDKDFFFMRNAAEKMGQLLDDLLEMSRVGRVVNPSVRITFRELVKEALDLLAGPIAEKVIAVTAGDADVQLYGDRRRLVELWQNLVENAVKFMGDPPAPRIEIGVARSNDEREFFIRDNGIGIEPAYAEKVFGLFEKLDHKSEGTGLGLALVKRIVEQYGGKIWIESEGRGKGTCFRFTLPGAVTIPEEAL